MALAGAAKGRQTQWAAQFLAAAELVRRGFTISFTLGNNTPVADLMVGSPSGKLFWVDVKGLSSTSDWLVKPKNPREDLFYILVYLDSSANERRNDRFFLLEQSEANSLEEAYRALRPGNKTTMPGFRFKEAIPHEAKWEKLPR